MPCGLLRLASFTQHHVFRVHPFVACMNFISFHHLVLINSSVNGERGDWWMLRAKCGLPTWFSGEEFTCQHRRCKFDPWIGKTPWKRKWQPTSIFLPGKSLEQRRPVGYNSWGCRESDVTE